MADDQGTELGGGESGGGESGSYFDTYTLVDDEGKPVGADSDPAGEQQQEQKTQDGNQQPAPAAKDEQNGDGKPKSKQPAPSKTSFEKRFFKAGDDGSEQFDSDGFVKFITESAQQQAQPRQFAQQQQPPAQQAQQPQPPKEPENPYLKRVRERQEYRKNLLAPADIFRGAFQQARQAGYDEQQSWLYAQQQWQAKVDEQAAMWEAQQEEAAAKERYESEQKRAKAMKYRSSRFSNESAYAKEFGTVDDFREFVIGRVENGQLVGGYANDVLWAMYNRDNPDKPAPTQEEFTEWYDRFASNPNLLHYLYEVAMSRVQRRHWPNIVQRIQSGQQQMQQQQKTSRTSKPSTRHAALGGQSGDDPLGGFMLPTV